MNQKIRGFSLIEILIVVTLMGVLIGISAPGIQRFYQNYNRKNSVEVLESSLSEGFSTSRSKNEKITISGKKSADFFSINQKKKNLFGNVQFQEDFQITYLPPFGDITEDSSEEIILKNNKSIVFRIYKKSGLIEKSLQLTPLTPSTP